MKLNELLKFNDIVIQCHDNPDADALASGFALYWYFTRNDKKPVLLRLTASTVRRMLLQARLITSPLSIITSLLLMLRSSVR